MIRLPVDRDLLDNIRFGRGGNIDNRFAFAPA
jgi:hypothetical protein